MIIQEDSIDDLLNVTFREIIENGEEIKSSTKGPNKELRNIRLVLNNPRSRISLSETRSTFISCIGEFLWYYSSSDDINFIKYYIKDYWKFIKYNENENTPVRSAYGPRIFGERNQFEAIKKLLVDKKHSRRAVIAIYSIDDVFFPNSGDIPCTCNLQFFIREGKLDLTVTMRSNDAYAGLVHDIFSFTMIQELMWASLKIDYPELILGNYTHFVGSLHLYNNKLLLVEHYLQKEGWQSKSFMHPIEPRLLTSDINEVMTLERELRVNRSCDEKVIENIKDVFWKEIATLLIAYFYITNEDSEKLEGLLNHCTSDLVTNFLNKKIYALEDQLIRKNI